MTYLLLQTFLLLLASYFFGAFLACTVKSMIFAERYEAPERFAVPVTVDAPVRPPIATFASQPVRTRGGPPPVVPRSIDPVQPKIDVLRRPEPRPVLTLVDPSRFERALMGPDPNEGMPRNTIPEICPAVLQPVTGAYYPGTYGPPEPEPEPPPPHRAMEPTPVARAPALPLQEAPPQNDTHDAEIPPRLADAEIEPPKRAALSDATTWAAASAVAAAKAAAAASIAPMLRTLTPRSPRPTLMEKLSLSPDNEPVELDQLQEKLVEDEVAEEKVIEEEPLQPEQVDEEPLEYHGPEDTSETDELQDEPEIEEEEVAAPLPEPMPQSVVLTPIEGGDDFQRIRAIDPQLEQRLKMEGIDSFEHIAAWNAADIQRVSQKLGIPGRIDREQWVEQAQILAKGGETYYSRNRLAALKAAAPAPEPEIAEAGEQQQQSTGDPEEQSPPYEATNGPGPETVSEQVLPPEPSTRLSGVAAATHGRSVAEMAAAAAAAIAAASASVTRGLKPIEPISPLSKVDPKISIPAKLSDAIKEKEAASATATAPIEAEPPRPMSAASHGASDDLKRIRGVGVLIEKRLNAIGTSRYDQIANWTSGDIDRVSQMLEFKGRIEREGWVEQARILLNGGHTEFSRRVDRGEVDTSRET